MTGEKARTRFANARVAAMLVVLLCVVYTVFPELLLKRTERVWEVRMANKVTYFRLCRRRRRRGCVVVVMVV